MSSIAIVGANRGIGLAVAQAYVAQGRDVIALCRNTSPELLALNVKVMANVDVTDDASVTKLAADLGDQKIDLLIHNAGILKIEKWPELDFDGIREQFEVNTLGPLRLVQALRGHLADDGKVAIVTSRMGSIEDNTSGGAYGYRISKCAVNMAAKSLSVDLAQAGHAVGVFHPGYVKTDMTQGRGYVSAQEAAAMLVIQFDKLSMDTTGQFFHANGEALPW
jgi:NAD(P)-dependent dehydrogenase (short-subunit alcohol dehydrogenase family)